MGSVDGDSAAAMRYTEARLSKIFTEMLRGINKNTVDFMPNFDGEEEEPTILPSRFPNLLVNGSDGIAVGMATNIPPHNLGEVIDAVIHLAENDGCSIDELIQYIKAPDFPTGGEILGKDLDAIYKTGSGKVVVRAKYHIEVEKHKNIIIIDEIPYQVNKAKLVEKIEYIRKNHKETDKKTKKEKEIKAKIPEIAEVRDESDREGMRIVIELRKGESTDTVINKLFKYTQLQDNFSVNMLALVDNEPKVLDLKTTLKCFLEHQKDVVTRETKFELEKALARLHILEGLKIAYDNLDNVLNIIRESKSSSDAKENLIAKFKFSEIQAKYILDLRLHKLTSLEIQSLEKEVEEVKKKVDEYNSILNDENCLIEVIKNDLLEIKEKYGDNRRSKILDEYEEIAVDEVENIENYNVNFYLTSEGYLKKIPLTSLRNSGEQKLKDGDYIIQENTGQNIDDILVFTNVGNVYRIKAYDIEDHKTSDWGIHLPVYLGLKLEEKIVGLINARYDNKDDSVLIFYDSGHMARVNINKYKSNYKILKGNKTHSILRVTRYKEDIEILFITENGKGLIIDTNDIEPINTRTAIGIKGIKLLGNDSLVDVFFEPHEDQKLVLQTDKKQIEIKLKKLTYKGNRDCVGANIYNCKNNDEKIVSCVCGNG
jgi:DNA gyrase subunit A